MGSAPRAKGVPACLVSTSVRRATKTRRRSGKRETIQMPSTLLPRNASSCAEKILALFAGPALQDTLYSTRAESRSPQGKKLLCPAMTMSLPSNLHWIFCRGDCALLTTGQRRYGLPRKRRCFGANFPCVHASHEVVMHGQTANNKVGACNIKFCWPSVRPMELSMVEWSLGVDIISQVTQHLRPKPKLPTCSYPECRGERTLH